MAAKTATICAGHQQNGTRDCVAFPMGTTEHMQLQQILTMQKTDPYCTGAATEERQMQPITRFSALTGLV